MKVLKVTLSLILVFLVFSACSSSQSPTQRADRNQPKNYSQYSSLFAVLRSVPGVQVLGSESSPNIILRGSGSGGINDFQPLFVINNVVIGSNYFQANAQVIPADIASVRVLNGLSATNKYGQEGRGGVIMIQTKGDKN